MALSVDAADGGRRRAATALRPRGAHAAAVLVLLARGVGGLASPRDLRAGGARREAAARLGDSVLGPTVWSEFGQLGRETNAVNLGQGFPDWAPPQFVLDAGMQAMSRNCHQYTRTAGHPPLTAVLARRYSAHLGQPVDADAEIAVTVGASQALFLALQALVDPGEEVLLMEPAFDLYYGQIRCAGATAVGLPLDLDPVSGEWTLDIEVLRRKITPRTRALVLNSPHNPTGKVFSRAEMEAVAAVVREHPRLIVISDEVYKYTVHLEPHTHEHFAQLDGMFERTVTVSSAGARGSRGRGGEGEGAAARARALEAFVCRRGAGGLDLAIAPR
jgi:DNA-binding transcriptional MocR family regulator